MDFSGNSNYPLGMRCNNPLNVAAVPTGWHGQTSIYSNPEHEAIFDDTVNGLRAGIIVLYNYYTLYGLKTIRDIINRWAPSDDPNANNDPNSYANLVANETGIDADTEFDLNADNIIAIAKAMAIEEQGEKYAKLIPDSDYIDAVKAANKAELVIKAATGIGILIFAVIGFYLLTKK